MDILFYNLDLVEYIERKLVNLRDIIIILILDIIYI